MNFTTLFVEWLASRLRVPVDALDMFKAANRLSGLDRKTLPSELIPLNTRQIARGVLNFTILQSSPGWVLPFWTERQYDPSNPAFVPRSHLGLSMNVTHRNWTAVGNPDCPVEPIVDPAGLVTPFPGGWSVDVWVRVGADVVFPSRSRGVRQRLVDNVPIVETAVKAKAISLTTTAFTTGSQLVQEIEIENLSRRTVQVEFCVAIRPFNPEGVSLINDLAFDEEELCWLINGIRRVFLSRPPDSVCCKSYEEGDAAGLFISGGTNAGPVSVHCPTGLANGFTAWTARLRPGAKEKLRWITALSGSGPAVFEGADRMNASETWDRRLKEGVCIETPDTPINAITRASRATLLMLSDGHSITPGPSTYHQFWFRDAAYMLAALDRFGHHAACREVIRSFPEYQNRAGYFRSQQGEWDSNGQAIWTVWQHLLLAGARDVAESHLGSLRRGVQWIKRTRQRGGDHASHFAGLLPAGLSAEHLGLADHYFWDNFWSLAGVKAFADISRRLGGDDDERDARKLAAEYRRDIDQAIRSVQHRRCLKEIPASPARGIDHGMIGSCSALYPLQLYPPDDEGMLATLETLTRLYLRDGLFFQNFIHSGLNVYLTMHLAHAWLLSGERKRFWELLRAVVDHASPTWSFPEAIHPITGGGSMGDGHHGWAAAEILLAVRDALLYERWSDELRRFDIVLMGGIPEGWFAPGQSFSIDHAPVPGGKLSMHVSSRRSGVEVKLSRELSEISDDCRWILNVPFVVESVRANGQSFPSLQRREGESLIELPMGNGQLDLMIQPAGRLNRHKPSS